MEIDKNNINYNSLKIDMLYMLEIALREGFLDAEEEYMRVDKATNDELIEYAVHYDFDLEDYKMPDKSKLWIPENKKLKFNKKD